MISSFSFSLGVSTACLNSHIVSLWLQLFCQLSLTMTFLILSAECPIFETEYNTGDVVSVLKETTGNYSCLPKTTSVTPLKESRAGICLHNVRVALVLLKAAYRRGNILWLCLLTWLPALQERLPGQACSKTGGKKHADVKSLGDISTTISWKGIF